MNIKSLVFALANVLAMFAVASQRVSFNRKTRDGVIGTFSGMCYSMERTGPAKIRWFPSPACWIDSSLTSRTCKVWAIMPLQKVERNDALPIWHYSQKPGSHQKEPSTRYQIQYSGAVAESNVTFDVCIENVFDIDAGDIFEQFGHDDVGAVGLDRTLLRRRDFPGQDLESIQCSSGRIEADGEVLMYGLTIRQDGECCFVYSANGMGDDGCFRFTVKEGKLYAGNGRLMGSKPEIESTSPGLSAWLSDHDTVSLRISYNHKLLRSPEVRSSDIHISLCNLLSIFEWISLPQDKRGVWRATGRCSLDKRFIF